MLGDSNKIGSKRAVPLKPAEEIENPALQLGHLIGFPWGTFIDQQTYLTVFDETQNIPFYSAYVIKPDNALKIGTYYRGDAEDEWTEKTIKGIFVYIL